jgi:hypothetical protein
MTAVSAFFFFGKRWSLDHTMSFICYRAKKQVHPCTATKPLYGLLAGFLGA